jgi:hypothetical protein
MRMFEKGVLNTLHGPKRKKVPGQNKTKIRAIQTTLDVDSTLHTPKMIADVFPVLFWKE